MTRTNMPIPGPQRAVGGLSAAYPHDSAPARSLAYDLSKVVDSWPVVFDEDVETTCEYGPHRFHEDEIQECDYRPPLGAIPGEPDYDENYYDAKRDDAA